MVCIDEKIRSRSAKVGVVGLGYVGLSLAVACYRVTEGFPRLEQHGLASQMRRAAISIASNIVEGAARISSKEFIQFLYISLGSASELDTQIEIAKKIGLGNTSESVKTKIPKSQSLITNH